MQALFLEVFRALLDSQVYIYKQYTPARYDAINNIPSIVNACMITTNAFLKAKLIIMPPPLIGGGIKRCFCLTSVCLTSVCLSVCRVNRA